ncbi:vegetative cell wall protein gp1-like [Daphnia pulicaria]|uniref:vegetative cell wall protein gp1-like n=1 Tax=Daphnia pulicaria TaxID=35523 RepID=UPI001EEBCFD0|nr:vegetative cell wall protein gp1-like [Daphnia pulicaria]
MKKSNDSPTPPPANLTSIPDPKKILVKPAPAAKLVPTKKMIPAPPRPKVAPASPKTEPVGSPSEDKPAAPVKPSAIKATSESVTPVSQGSSSPQSQRSPATSKSLFPARSNGPAPIPPKTVPVVTPNSAARPAVPPVIPMTPGSVPPQSGPATSASSLPAKRTQAALIPPKIVPAVVPNSVARPAEALGKPSTVPEISSSKATSAGAPKLPVANEPQSDGLTGGGKEERTPKQPKISSNKISWKKICRNTLLFFFCCCLP